MSISSPLVYNTIYFVPVVLNPNLLGGLSEGGLTVGHRKGTSVCSVVFSDEMITFLRHVYPTKKQDLGVIPHWQKRGISNRSFIIMGCTRKRATFVISERILFNLYGTHQPVHKTQKLELSEIGN